MDPRLVLSTVSVIPNKSVLLVNRGVVRNHKGIVSEVKGEISKKDCEIGRNKSLKMSCPDRRPVLGKAGWKVWCSIEANTSPGRH